MHTLELWTEERKEVWVNDVVEIDDIIVDKEKFILFIQGMTQFYLESQDEGIMNDVNLLLTSLNI